MMLNERRDKKKRLGFTKTLKRNGTQKKGLEKTKERRKTHVTTRARTSKMADAEAKPVVEFTKVLLSHITTTRFFFFKICLEMLLFFLPSLSRV